MYNINIKSGDIMIFEWDEKKNLANQEKPHQTLINMYLRDCMANDCHLDITWK